MIPHTHLHTKGIFKYSVVVTKECLNTKITICLSPKPYKRMLKGIYAIYEAV